MTTKLDIDRLSTLGRSEWVLTNGLGGYAMGTANAVPERRYHGWLVGAMQPPVGRVMGLHSAIEWLAVQDDDASGLDGPRGRRYELSSFRFRGAGAGVIHPKGMHRLEQFEQGAGWVRWGYLLEDGVTVTRELTLVRESNTALLRYRVTGLRGKAWLEVRPLVALRDFHSLHPERAGFGYKRGDGWCEASGPAVPGVASLAAGSRLWMTMARDVQEKATFVPEPEWWRNFEYTRELERGMDGVEDVYSPGVFMVECDHGDNPDSQVVLAASLDGPIAASLRFDEVIAGHRARVSVAALPRGCAAAGLVGKVPELAVVVEAADQFVVRRGDLPSRDHGRHEPAASRHLVPARVTIRELSASTGVKAAEITKKLFMQGMMLKIDDSIGFEKATEIMRGFGIKLEVVETRSTIIAGYPWFSDWGRDTFISMRGLLLCTGRFEEALSVLRAFAAMQKNGLIPNCFDNAGHAEYNTVDASLWYVHAACEYLRVSEDRAGFDSVLPACLQVIDAYRRGTEFEIRMEEDGLIAAGSEGTQLTWMDARRDGVVFTPRHGKAVEINALWYSGLMELAGAVSDKAKGVVLRELAARVNASFGQFWNHDAGCLFDVLTPVDGGWRPDGRVRPNQVFAVSQPHSVLFPEQKMAVLAKVKERLLTPVGLRTLDAGDPGYRARYEGPIKERDAAYHNGTVWPWLIGAYCEGMLRAGEFSAAAREEVRGVISPLVREMCERGSQVGPIRQLAEVYDGEERPGHRRAEGCMAQAWSVAEVLRVLCLVSNERKR